MSKKPNEKNYVGGKKHFTDVIKNSGPGDLLVWRQPEEDFNTNSTLIVFPSEQAIFFNGGLVEQVFDEGTYRLSTENYPFISRLRNAFSGGVSAFSCVVYFVRKAHSMEILWGTESPIQLRDPVQRIATSVRARGAIKIQIDDGVKFLNKLVGNNISTFSQDSLLLYFRNEFMQYIKSSIARAIKTSDEEILGICAEQDILAEKIRPLLQEPLSDYGIRLITFSIAGIEVPENDSNRQKLEAAYATKRESVIYGQDYGRFVAREVMTDVANNPEAGGVASAGAGLGLGLGAAPVFGAMAQQIFTPMQPEQQPTRATGPSGRFVQKGAVGGNVVCPSCQAQNPPGSKFCNACGAKLPAAEKKHCPNCGAELSANARFCNECGTKVE